MNLLCLYARHGTESYADAFESLKERYTRHFDQTNVDWVIIDNAMDEDFQVTLPDGTLLLGASDAFREFTSWDKALETLRPTLIRYDFVHLVTSAYEQLYNAYIDRIKAPILEMLRGRDIALGHIDMYNDPVHFLGCGSQAWLRSSYLFIPPGPLMRLRSVLSLRDFSAWFTGDPARPFRDDAPISHGMRSDIIGWLTGAGTGQGTEWHSRFELTEKNLPLFEQKSIAIMNEHALSLRLLAQGTNWVDATWMSAISRGASGAKQASITDWRRQVEERKPFL